LTLVRITVAHYCLEDGIGRICFRFCDEDYFTILVLSKTERGALIDPTRVDERIDLKIEQGASEKPQMCGMAL